MDAHVIDDLFAAEALNRQAADENVKPDQILAKGEFFLREAHGFQIYGEILDVGDLLLDGRNLADLDEDEREEYDEEAAVYAQPHMKFYRFTKSHSKLCPHGELGDIHLSTVTRKLTRQEFQAAKTRGWK
jgi:hypothetical protein